MDINWIVFVICHKTNHSSQKLINKKAKFFENAFTVSRLYNECHSIITTSDVVYVSEYADSFTFSVAKRKLLSFKDPLIK